MTAIDSSVLVAIGRREVGFERYVAFVTGTNALTGAPTYIETKMALSSLPQSQVDDLLDSLRSDGRLTVVDFTPAMAEVAVDAFRRYGKGRGHPAQLNFGDCMSYAVAKTRRIPLLYRGDGFARTDIEAAWRP